MATKQGTPARGHQRVGLQSWLLHDAPPASERPWRTPCSRNSCRWGSCRRCGGLRMRANHLDLVRECSARQHIRFEWLPTQPPCAPLPPLPPPPPVHKAGRDPQAQQQRTRLVVPCHNQAHAVGPLPAALRARLRAVRHLAHHAAQGHGRVVHKPAVQGARAVESNQVPGKQAQARKPCAGSTQRLQQACLCTPGSRGTRG